MRKIVSFGLSKRSEEAKYETGRVGERENRCHNNDNEDDRRTNEITVVDVTLKGFLFRDEPEERRHPSH